MNLNLLSFPGISDLENLIVRKAIRQKLPESDRFQNTKKILFVIKRIEDCGGVETRLLQYADLLVRHGYSVTFVTETNRFVPLNRFPCYHLNFHACNFEKSIIDLITRLGIDTVELQIKSNKYLKFINVDNVKKYCRVGCCIHGNIRRLDVGILNRMDYRILISDTLFHIDYSQLQLHKILPIAIADNIPQWRYCGQRTALLVSRIGRDKYNQIASFTEYCQTHGIPFRIAGPLISHSTVKRLKKCFNLQSCHFIGKLDDTIEYLSKHTNEYLFVAGVGQVLLEAGSLGYPCYLTSDLGTENSTFITQRNIQGNFGCNLTLAYKINFANVEQEKNIHIGELRKYDISNIIKERFNIQNRYAEYEKYVFEKSHSGWFVNIDGLVGGGSKDRIYSTADKRYDIAFNGRIYNYKELAAEHGIAANSEQELLASLYSTTGIDMFKMLRGMFAIAIYDHELNEVVCARDRFGIKTLYYRRTNNGITFASKLTGFSQSLHKTDINCKGINHFFTFEYIPEPQTVYNDVFALRGGYWARFSEYGEEVKCFAQKDFAVLPQSTGETRKYKVRAALEDSIAMCMRGESVKGIFLSGGIDSSIIAALSSRINSNIKAFTIGFASTEYHSEVRLAETTADYLGIELIARTFTAEDFVSAFDKTMDCFDSPMADPSAVGEFLLAEMAARHVGIVLSGEGADELFGGYKVYGTTEWSMKCKALQPIINVTLRNYARLLPKNSALRETLKERYYSLKKHYVGPTCVMGYRERRKLLLPEWYTQVMPSEITAQYFGNRAMTRLQKMQICDWNLWLPCDMLYQADRVTAANAIEVRVPFLDDRVYDAARILTDSDKVKNGENKALLRETFSDLLPYETVHRPKKGFPVPVSAWLRNELYDWAADILNSPAAAELIHTTYALRLLELHRKGADTDPRLFRQLWLLLSLIKWVSHKGKET